MGNGKVGIVAYWRFVFLYFTYSRSLILSLHILVDKDRAKVETTKGIINIRNVYIAIVVGGLKW